MSIEQCHLLSGWFAIGVQVLLASLCVATLVIKKLTEKPERDWIVWFFDAGKQGMSSSLSHITNIVLSIVIANKLPHSDECMWYCIAYTSDTIVGTCINFLFLSIVEKLINSYCSPNIAEYLRFGSYGNPPSIYHFIPQITIWLSIVMVSKFIVLFVIVEFIYQLDSIVGSVFKFTQIQSVPKIELLVVMIVIPMILNAIQFWVTDTVLKKTSTDMINEVDDIIINEDKFDDEDVNTSVELLQVTNKQKLKNGFPSKIKTKTSLSRNEQTSSIFGKSFGDRKSYQVIRRNGSTDSSESLFFVKDATSEV